MKLTLHGFNGIQYRISDNWFSSINVNDYQIKPIKYLEIGTFYGANAISVEKSYASHRDSKLYCIDPWEDYDDYPEYKGQQESTYSIFCSNIAQTGKKDKFVIHRGYSHNVVPTFEDDFFDIIYIDGNHEPHYVLEDAVLCFRKLKKGGIMIFDDYGWGGPDLTQRGIDGFMSGYHKKVEKIGIVDTQVFLRKL